MENLRCKICNEEVENHDIEGLFKCGGSALKGRKWDMASVLFDQVISKNAEEPRAYFGKLMAECECTNEDDLMGHLTHIYDKDSYKKAYQYGDEDFKRQLENYNKQISYNVAGQMYNSKNMSSIKSALDTFTDIIDYKDSRDMADKCREKIYGYALEHMQTAKKEKDFLAVKSEFEMISGYSDADAKAAECASRSDESTNLNAIYQEALKLGRSDSPIDLKNAMKKLEEIIDYRDAKDKLEIFKNRYQKMSDQTKEDQRQAEVERENTLRRMQQEEEQKAKRAAVTKIIVAAVFAVIIIIVAVIFIQNTPDTGSGSAAVLLSESAATADILSDMAENIDIFAPYMV